MGKDSKFEYWKAIYSRYSKATTSARIEMLNEFCAICDYNRKYAIGVLNGPPPILSKKQPPKKRAPIYGHPVTSVLTATMEDQLRRISPRTIDYKLKSKKRLLKKSLYGRTKPGTLLKHHNREKHRVTF